MSNAWADLRYAFRTLRRAPLFTGVVVLTLALGIGANSTIFSIVNAVLLNGMPFDHPDQLVHMQVRSDKGYLISVSLPNYHDWQSEARSFSSIAATSTAGFNLLGKEGAEHLQATLMIGDFFGTLGVHPLIGRAPTANETERGAAATAVLSYRFWQSHFGGSSSALGQTIVLDGRTYSIIGVAPPSMRYPALESDLYLPLGASPDYPWDDRDAAFGLETVARLKSGVTLAAAQSDMDRVAQDIQQRTHFAGTVPVRSLRDETLGDVAPALLALTGAVALVLLIACANIGGLLIARGESRQHELALRSALGASASRMVRQLLTETLLLAVAGGTLGVGIAVVGVRFFGHALPATLPIARPTQAGLPVFVFTGVLTISTALLFGLLPAIRASRAQKLGERLAAGGARVGGSAHPLRFRTALVAAEIALSLVLLVGATLMLRSVSALRAVDPGFQSHNVLTMRLAPNEQTYADSARWLALYEEIVAKTRALPGVQTVALSNAVPLFSGGYENGALPEGRADTHENRESALVLSASADYFTAMGVQLIHGRYFTSADTRTSTPVAVIDETMAQKFWPNEDPIGKRLMWEPGSQGVPKWRQVVGVVRNIHYYQLERPSRITAYRPVAQATYNGAPALYLFVKSSGDPHALAASVRQVIKTIDANIPVYRTQTMDDVLNQYLTTTHLLEQLLGIFAALALILAALGTYGLIAYTVARRTRELGIRMALGATSRQTVQLIMRRGLAIAGVGIGCGLVGAVLASRALSASLFGVKALDPIAYLVASALLTAIALVACWVPARRASRIAPGIALRAD